MNLLLPSTLSLLLASGYAAAASGTPASSGSAPAGSPPAEKRLPNVVIIYADDVGYGDLSCYGATAVQTPNVDRLAREGVRCLNAYAGSATSTPSRYAMLTGHYAWRRQGTGVATGDASLIIPPQTTTVADIMQRAGYTTGVVGKWHLGLGVQGQQDWNGTVTPGPADIGFNYSYIMAATGDRVPCVFMENQKVVGLDPSDPISVSYQKPFPGEPLGKTHPELLKLHPSHGHDMTIVNGISRIGYMKGGTSALWVDENIADSITLKAVQFIEANQQKPFFLYFGTHDIHVPRVPHARFVGKSGMGPRGDAILSFDWSVGQVLNTLDRLGLTENTLVILSSDNGPVVDDGYKDQAVELLGNHKPSGILRGGKYSAFDAGTRVPFLVRWPAQVKPKTSTALISQPDFIATLAALTGQTLQSGEAPDSQNQLAAWTGKDPKGRKHVVQSAGTLSYREGIWKYIAPSNGPAHSVVTNTELGNNKQEQLYRLDRDPSEQQNLATQNPKKLQQLKQNLERIRETGK